MKPVIKGCANILIHVPDFIRYGSKPFREIEKDQEILLQIEKHTRTFQEFVSYPPNQVFIGNLSPDDLRKVPRPWFENPIPLGKALCYGKFGEIMPEDEFYGLLKLSDLHQYDLIWLEKDFTQRLKEKLKFHPLFDEEDLEQIGEGKTIEEIQKKIGKGKWWSIPLFHKGKLIGCFNRSKDEHALEDEALGPQPLMESLVAKASGVLALKYLLKKANLKPDKIDYILSCSEEAVGDRYNRGGGSLAKAIGETCRCQNATGPDIKAFCVGPVYAAIMAASLVKSGVAKKVAVVGGGCLAKIGMKFEGHLKKGMPIIEDALGAIAFLVTTDDKESPVIRLDAVGKCSIKTGGKPGEATRAVVLEPLKKIGKRIIDIDKYAVQLENPEITEPSGTSNVPKKHYKPIASSAAVNKEIAPQDIKTFELKYGLPGFAPTQGHISAAVPYLGHALEAIKAGEIENAMFVARGSIFLGRMSQLRDAMSFIIEKNHRR